MIKIFTCTILLVFFAHAHGQKIKVNETDRFTREQRLETEYFKVYSTIKTGIYAQLWCVSDRNYISVGAYGYGSPVIGLNDRLVILTSTDSTIVCSSPEIQTGNLNGTFTFKYKISMTDLYYLSTCTVKAMRIEGGRTNIEMDIPEKNRNKLQRLFEVYVKEKK